MAQYARFDPQAASPAPVTGWYDASAFEYPNLPVSADLLAVTQAQWALHFEEPNGWTVSNGQLTPPSNS
jgi:hypothetical protein